MSNELGKTTDVNVASGASAGPSATHVPASSGESLSQALSPLTRREHEVLELMAFGLSNKEIARRLALGRRTVETHIDHVLGKLNVPTRTRAVVEAGRAGLLKGRPKFDVAVDNRPNNLPFQLTTLLGREQDLNDVKSLLEKSRLVTLSGSGGVGKTRLALGFGFDALDMYADGVWFADFSSVSDSELTASVVAKVLSVPENKSRTLSESIAFALRQQKALLILDNCEHVLDAVAELADEILHTCAEVHILATSRQPLGIIGESVHRVSSLESPQQVDNLKADQALCFGAVLLFTDRARAAEATFTLTDENASVVAEICRRLDGIPLAIELAATRVNAVSLESLSRSLGDRFRVLTATSRTSFPRHKTLTALIDWSYDLLSPAEQRLFDQLGIFAGPFNLQAAVAVAENDGLSKNDTMDLLVALVDKSLVVVQTGTKQERYRLLESTRAYALDKLRSTGERERVARRHAEYFRDQARASDERFGIGSTVAWLADTEPDLENYRATLEWALSGGHDIPLGSTVAGTLERFWALAGLAVEARWWLGAALERLDERKYPAIAARLWRAKARFVQGQPMRDCIKHALDLYESVGDSRGAAHALRTLAFSLLQMGLLDEANDVISQAIKAMRNHGDRPGLASCLSMQGVSAYSRGEFARARDLYSQALTAYRALGDESATANVLGNIGELEFADGHPELALSAVTESLAITSRGKQATDLAIDYNNAAAYQIALGNLEAARASARDGVRLAQPERNSWNIAVAIQHLALVSVLLGQTTNAARLLGFVNARFKELELERETTEKWGYEKLKAALCEKLGAEEVKALEQDGAIWSEEEAIDVALRV